MSLMTGRLQESLGAFVQNALTLKGLSIGVALLLFTMNAKGLPGFWHVRVFKTLITQLYLSKPEFPESDGLVADIRNDYGASRPRLFGYLVTTCNNPIIECDYNMHKSNSTFFSDLDVNRSALVAALFQNILTAGSRARNTRGQKKKPLRIALGGTSCIFRREIKPFQSYEVWSRVLTWDDKWLYIVSYFTRKGRPSAKKPDSPADADVLGSCVARYVFKDGRVSVRPADALQEMGLIPIAPTASNGAAELYAVSTSGKKWSWVQIEEERLRGMEMGKLFGGLEVLPSRFDPTEVGVLGRYSDF